MREVRLDFFIDAMTAPITIAVSIIAITKEQAYIRYAPAFMFYSVLGHERNDTKEWAQITIELKWHY